MDSLHDLMLRKDAGQGYARAIGDGRLAYSDPASNVVGVNDGEHPSATFILSTRSQDSDGDVIEPTGFDLSQFKDNPTWLAFHGENAHFPLPIGTAQNPVTKELGVRVEKDRVLATCWFDKGQPFAMELHRMVKAGLLRGASPGFIPLAADPIRHRSFMPTKRQAYHIKRSMLKECSIVPLPANSEALRLALKNDEYSPLIKKALGGAIQKNLGTYSDTAGGVLVGARVHKDLQECVGNKIAVLIREGYKQDQAAAIAYSMCRKQQALKKKGIAGLCPIPPYAPPLAIITKSLFDPPEPEPKILPICVRKSLCPKISLQH